MAHFLREGGICYLRSICTTNSCKHRCQRLQIFAAALKIAADPLFKHQIRGLLYFAVHVQIVDRFQIAAALLKKFERLKIAAILFSGSSSKSGDVSFTYSWKFSG